MRKQVCTLCGSPLQDKVFGIDIRFIGSNQDWIVKMAEKCKTSWYGTLTISIKNGVPTHAKWQDVDLLEGVSDGS